MARITVDPITRIEGHLRIDVQVDGGRVTDSWSSAQAFRGIEEILKGKDPRNAWAMTQRFCGVCTTTHALCSIRTVEDALNVEIPVNAQMMRNIVMSIQSLQDHIVHFYHLTALDWVDIVSALKADPAKAGRIAQTLSDWPSNSVNEMKNAKERLAKFVGTGNLGIYSSGYWGHPDMRLSPEINLIAFAHYLQALDYQRRAAEAVAIIGGKNPHIQNLCVGGVTTALNMDSMAALNLERIQWIRTLLAEVRAFVEKVYIPDVLAIAGAYKDWFNIGKCSPNYIAAPDFPMNPDSTEFLMPGGIIMDGKFSEIKNWKDARFRDGITETNVHAWYSDGQTNTHPYEGTQTPAYNGFNENGKYSWAKAPRFEDKVTQTGPIAQILAGYYAKDPLIVKTVNLVAGKLGLQLEQLNSTMGRNACRAIRALVMIDRAQTSIDTLVNNYGKGDTSYVNYTEIPEGEYMGVGFNEAPRGMLSHWITIENKLIKHYSAVVPSTWTAGPRDNSGRQGPYEESLMNTKIAIESQPLEIIRSIHSFDPCIACAVHTVDVDGKEIVKVKVR